MQRDELVAPVLKWVGGKRQLLPELMPLFPEDIGQYCEPFVGGGAVLFALKPRHAWVGDINGELIALYRVIREDVDGLIEALRGFENEAETFYRIRDWDRDRRRYARLSPLKKAARLLYLNKTCFNGLFRVNSAGEFNTPFGRYKNPNIVNEEGLRAVSAYFRAADIEFFAGDYAALLERIPQGGFAYLDPPYDPVSDTANFTGYTRGGFDRGEQVRLRECCDALNARGVRFMLSNSATDFIKEQYAAYDIRTVHAKRAINSVGGGRGAVEEVVVRNYGG